MSQFDAIERTLRGYREARQDRDAPQGRVDAIESAAYVGSEQSGGPDALGGPAARDGGDPAVPARRPYGRRRVALLACGVAAVVIAGAVTALAATHSTRDVVQRGHVQSTPTPDEIQAALWVVVHVAPDHVVACDVELCALVRQSGAPAASLVTVGSDFTAVERADVLISTPLVRRQFGAQLAALSPPEVLASFGSGADRIEVAAVALGGGADYGRRLVLDRAARRHIGTAMAHSPRITFLAPTAAVELADGLVDSRICSLLTLISSSHMLTVASFSGIGPGAGADIPASGVVISRLDGRLVGGSTPQYTALIALIDAQQPPYRPLSVVSEGDGVKIIFSQPQPLGLIAGAGS